MSRIEQVHSAYELLAEVALTGRRLVAGLAEVQETIADTRRVLYALRQELRVLYCGRDG